jgi:hypothetical protein
MEEPPEWFRTYLDIYFQVRPHMERRQLLPGGRGVLWNGRSGQVLFSFDTFEYAVPDNAAVQRVGFDRPILHRDGTLAVDAWAAYEIQASR